MSNLREAARALIEDLEFRSKLCVVDVSDSVCQRLPAAFAQPEDDHWLPASKPPETTRSVLMWLRFGEGVETFGKTLGGPNGFAFQNGAITHWRDVTSPAALLDRYALEVSQCSAKCG